LCVAAAFGFVATLGAQSSTSTTTAQTPSTTSSDREVTLTGCLERGTSGNYILADARQDTGMSRSGATTGTTATGTSGTTAGTTSATGTSTGTTAGNMNAAAAGSTWTLEGSKDLDKHVGHKIQVTGREVAGSSRNEASAGSATTTTAGATTTAGTSTTAGATGTSGTEQHQHMSETSGHTLDVKSVTMISSSCS
jgi:hypothetical protein